MRPQIVQCSFALLIRQRAHVRRQPRISYLRLIRNRHILRIQLLALIPLVCQRRFNQRRRVGIPVVPMLRQRVFGRRFLRVALDRIDTVDAGIVHILISICAGVHAGIRARAERARSVRRAGCLTATSSCCLPVVCRTLRLRIAILLARLVVHSQLSSDFVPHISPYSECRPPLAKLNIPRDCVNFVKIRWNDCGLSKSVLEILQQILRRIAPAEPFQDVSSLSKNILLRHAFNTISNHVLHLPISVFTQI